MIDNMTNDDTVSNQKNKKYSYQEYYEMGLKIAKGDAKEEADSTGTKEN